MGIMRIALCDDEASLAQSYAGRIREWALRTGISCRISILSSPEELLFEIQDRCLYDLLLLDIEMPGMNGLELARRIRRTDSKVMIVFLTNYDHFVFQGYEVGAFRYLMKAEVPGKLEALMDAAAAWWEEEKEYLLVRAGGGEERLELTEILYLEASRHDTILHTLTRERLLKLPISGLAVQLPDYFVPAHRSYIVNLRYVEKLSRTECLMHGGARVPVGRAAYGALNEAFIEYYKKLRDIEIKSMSRSMDTEKERYRNGEKQK